ncbi:MAG: hypothetical protein ACO1RX_20415 [Candidatus Sericytochromatia bacterium]
MLKNFGNGWIFLTPFSFEKNVHLVHFNSKKNHHKFDIAVPQTGDFQLKIVEGSSFKILDDDANDDNMAVIQMPSNTFKTYIYLQKQNNARLNIRDQLYYVNDTLQTNLSERWLSLGNRPVSIPQDWGSADGSNFVLRFNAESIKGFYMAWVKTSVQADAPVGISTIGPNGGTVALPGVGKVVIPAGALSENTPIRIKEVLDAPVENLFPASVEFEGGTANTLKEYISPVIEVSPAGLQLRKRAAVYLKINETRLGNNHPGMVERYILIKNAFGYVFDWKDDSQIGVLAEDRTLETPFYVEQLGVYYQAIDSFIRPEDSLMSISVVFDTPALEDGDTHSLPLVKIKKDYNINNFDDWRTFEKPKTDSDVLQIKILNRLPYGFFHFFIYAFSNKNNLLSPLEGFMKSLAYTVGRDMGLKNTKTYSFSQILADNLGGGQNPINRKHIYKIPKNDKSKLLR